MKTVIPSEISLVQLQLVMQTAVSPRPIALASTVDKNGDINLSPFSFFNMFSTVPPILIFSPSRRVRDNTTKHTLENVLEVREVVIGTVNYPIVQQISLASTEYGDGVNEFIKSGLTMKDADLVKPKLIQKIHIREEYLDEQGNLDQAKLDMVARLGGNWYSRNNEDNLFEVPKPLVTKGIGFDLLPDSIKYSKVFTGNDLGMLANIEFLPSENCHEDENIHQNAQKLLLESKIDEAWRILIK